MISCLITSETPIWLSLLMGYYKIYISFGILMLVIMKVSTYLKTDVAGERFEKSVAAMLDKKNLGTVHRNVIFNKVSRHAFRNSTNVDKLALVSKETEADIILVNKKGIFCFECKKREGLLDGSSGPYWNVHGYSSEDRMQNPFRQNYKHVKAIEELGLGNVFSIVCTNAEFKYTYAGRDKLSKESPYYSFLTNREHEAIIRHTAFSHGIDLFAEDLKTLPDVYTNEEVSSINRILGNHIATKKERKNHAKYMQFRREHGGE